MNVFGINLSTCLSYKFYIFELTQDDALDFGLVIASESALAFS